MQQQRQMNNASLQSSVDAFLFEHAAVSDCPVQDKPNVKANLPWWNRKLITWWACAADAGLMSIVSERVSEAEAVQSLGLMSFHCWGAVLTDGNAVGSLANSQTRLMLLIIEGLYKPCYHCLADAESRCAMLTAKGCQVGRGAFRLVRGWPGSHVAPTLFYWTTLAKQGINENPFNMMHIDISMYLHAPCPVSFVNGGHKPCHGSSIWPSHLSFYKACAHYAHDTLPITNWLHVCWRVLCCLIWPCTLATLSGS